MSEAKAGATRPYPLRIPENLLELAEAKSREERTDRSTALRQLLYAGAEEYVLELLSEGRISAGRAAGILEVSVHRVHRIAEEHGVEIGATIEEYRRSKKDVADLLR
jgi:predicted HTH domain antitoxin